MTVPSSAVARLSAALADRYRLERELGAGGMATVYLAQDLKHDRKVAIKVLKPELAAVLGADRFVQEIKTPRRCNIRTSCPCSIPGRRVLAIWSDLDPPAGWGRGPARPRLSSHGLDSVEPGREGDLGPGGARR